MGWLAWYNRSVRFIKSHFARAQPIFNPFPKQVFVHTCLQDKSFENTVGDFSFSHSVFYLFRELSAIFIKCDIVVCKLLVWTSLKFIVWESVKLYVFHGLGWCKAGTLHYHSQSCSINPFPNKPWFLCVCRTRLLKTLVTSNFSFSHSVFFLFGEHSAISSNLKLSSANSFSLDEFKTFRLEKGYAICLSRVSLVQG